MVPDELVMSVSTLDLRTRTTCVQASDALTAVRGMTLLHTVSAHLQPVTMTVHASDVQVPLLCLMCDSVRPSLRKWLLHMLRCCVLASEVSPDAFISSSRRHLQSMFVYMAHVRMHTVRRNL